MIVWLEKALVLAIHDRQLAEHGGSAGLRDEALLESALARPQQLHAYGDPAPDLADLASALAYGVARNHPFVDGNKRTAHIAYRTFLTLNGAELVTSDEEKYVHMLALAEGKLSERDFAAWLRDRLRFGASGKAHQPRRRYVTMQMERIKSSAIARVRYDFDRKVLRLEYRNGRLYDYFDVPLEVYEELLDAESAGEFVNRVIKPNYEYSEAARQNSQTR
jgi:death on curing protein